MKLTRYQNRTEWFTTTMLSAFILLALTRVSLSDDIRASIQSLGDHPSWNAKARLEKFPPEVVVPAIVESLQNDAAYLKEPTRSFAYSVLFNSGAAQFPEGLDQVLVGLSDPTLSIQLNCAYALTLTPSDDQPRIVSVIINRLKLAETSPKVKQALLHPLTKYEGASKVALPIIQEIFEDAAVPLNLRSTAAQALISIGGAKTALPIFRLPRYRSSKHVFDAITRYGVETDGMSNTDATLRKEFREIAREGVAHDDVGVRRSALRSLFALYGNNVYTKTQSEFILNPILAEIMRQMVQNDPDASMRKDAADLLQHTSDILRAKNGEQGQR